MVSRSPGVACCSPAFQRRCCTLQNVSGVRQSHLACVPQCKALEQLAPTHYSATALHRESSWLPMMHCLLKRPVLAFSTYSSREVPRSPLLSIQTHTCWCFCWFYVIWMTHRLVPGWINRFLSEFRIQIASWCKPMDRSCTLWRGWMATFLTNRIEAYLKIKEISTTAPQVPSTKLSAFFKVCLVFLAPRKAAAQNCGSDIIINLKVSDIYVRVQRGSEVDVFDSLLPARCFISPNCLQLISHADKWCMCTERWLLWLFIHTLYSVCRCFYPLNNPPKISLKKKLSTPYTVIIELLLVCAIHFKPLQGQPCMPGTRWWCFCFCCSA